MMARVFFIIVLICCSCRISHAMIATYKFDTAMSTNISALRSILQGAIDEQLNGDHTIKAQDIINTVKRVLSSHIDTYGLSNPVLNTCAYARKQLCGASKKDEHQKLTLHGKQVHTFSISAENGEPCTLCVAEGRNSSVSIWKNRDDQWICTDMVRLDGAPFVKYAYYIKPNKDDQTSEALDRLAVEVDDNSGRLKLLFYTKMVGRKDEGGTWYKENYHIDASGIIKAYGFSDGGQECVVITEALNNHNDILTLFQKSNNANTYIQMHQKLIHNNVMRVHWENSCGFWLEYCNTLNRIYIQGNRLVITQLINPDVLKKFWWKKILGWAIFGTRDRLSLIIDYPLAVAARCICAEYMKKSEIMSDKNAVITRGNFAYDQKIPHIEYTPTRWNDSVELFKKAKDGEELVRNLID